MPSEHSRLGRFLQVGAVGFAIDAALLWVLVYQFELSPVFSRAISFVATIVVTFVMHARYTFLASIRRSSKSRYVLVQITGAAINFLSYTGMVLYSALSDYPLMALVIGSALASGHNFVMMRKFVFAARSMPLKNDAS